MSVADAFQNPDSGTPERRPGDFRRSQWGAPIISNPDKPGKTVMYGRPSGFGSNLENSYNLIRWKERNLIRGLHVTTELSSVGDDIDNETADGIIARAYEAAEVSLAADRGTFVHALTDAADRGESIDHMIAHGEALGIPEALQRRIVAEWLAFRKELGVTPIGIEMNVVNDALRLAGPLDRLDLAERDIETNLGTIPAGGAFIGDTKTGKLTVDRSGTPKYWIKYPIQIVAYRDGLPYDTETDTRGEWPTVPHESIALIYHYDLAKSLDGESVDWQAIPVDLNVGREGAAVVLAGNRWIKRRDMFGPTVTSRRQQLRARYKGLADTDQRRFADLGINPDDLNGIEAGLDSIDPFAQHTEADPDDRTVTEPVAPLDEGGPATDDDRDALRAAWLLLEPEQAEWVQAVVGRTGNLSVEQSPTERRVTIGFALVQLAVAGWHDDALLASCLTHSGIADLAVCDYLAAQRLADTVTALILESLTFAVPPEGGDLRLIAA